MPLKHNGRKIGRTWTARVRCLECVFSTSGTSAANGGEGARLGAAAARHAGRTGHTVELVRTERVVFQRRE